MPGSSKALIVLSKMNRYVAHLAYINGSEYAEGNVFSFIGVAAAYSNGTEWFDQVIAYIQGNIDFTDRFLKRAYSSY